MRYSSIRTFDRYTTRSSSAGFIALITAIIVAASLLVFVTAIGLAGYHSRFSVHESDMKERSSYLAESCVNTAVLRLKQDASYSVGPWDGESVAVGDAACNIVSVENGPHSNERIIKTQGQSGGAYTDLTVTVALAAGTPDVTIEDYEETPTFPSGTITIEKTVKNDDGGIEDASDFTYRIDGNRVGQGIPITVTAGNHTLSEDDSIAYTASDWGGDCASNGTLNVVAGHDYSCTITNDDDFGIAENPPLNGACGGLDIALLADTSGSIDATALAQMKDAFKTFADSFSDQTVFSLSKFNDTATVLDGFSMSPSEAVTAIDGLGGATGGTNWEDGLAKAYSTFDPRPGKANVIVIASDGLPTRYGHAGNLHGNGHDSTHDVLIAAVDEANLIKTSGTRIIAIGIGNDVNIDTLRAIAGNNVNTGGANVDVVTTGFDTLASDLSALAEDLCAAHGG